MFNTTEEMVKYIIEHIGGSTESKRTYSVTKENILLLVSGLIVNITLINHMYKIGLHRMLTYNVSSFVCPTPKKGMDKTDFLIILLASDKYTFTPLTYAEPKWKDTHFQSAWTLLNRIYINDNKLDELNTLIHGRNSDSYLSSRGVEMKTLEIDHVDRIPVTEIVNAINNSPDILLDTSLSKIHQTRLDIVLEHIAQP